MLHVDVNELVGEKPPGLLPSLWVVDEKGTDGSLAGQDLLCDQAGDIVTVPDVENNLQKIIWSINLQISLTCQSENLF